MEIEVGEASRRLGVSDSRVRQMLRAGSLHGRRVGTIWLVGVDEVEHLARHPRRAGRPLAAARAWALLALLSGEDAPWLSPSARAQVRRHLTQLVDPSPETWLSQLRRRSLVLPVYAHPAALPRLTEWPHVLTAGPDAWAGRGFDLVGVDDAPAELYLPSDLWPRVSTALAIRRSDTPNLVVRLPHEVWPFGVRAHAHDRTAATTSPPDRLPDAALAADMLESSDPRVVSAGAGRLGELLAGWERERAGRAQRRFGSMSESTEGA